MKGICDTSGSSLDTGQVQIAPDLLGFLSFTVSFLLKAFVAECGYHESFVSLLVASTWVHIF
jgi:hypothetical protein